MACVGGGVVQHFGRQRTRRPVSSLVAFVEPYPEILLQEGRQSYARFVQELCRNPGVEQIGAAKPILMGQESEVVVGIVEYDLDLWVRQNLPDQGEIGHRKRIHNGGLMPGRHLEKVDPITKTMKACGLRVQRDERLRL